MLHGPSKAAQNTGDLASIPNNVIPLSSWVIVIKSLHLSGLHSVYLKNMKTIEEISNMLLFLQKTNARPNLRDNIIFVDAILLPNGPPITSNSNKSLPRLLKEVYKSSRTQVPLQMHNFATAKISNSYR